MHLSLLLNLASISLRRALFHLRPVTDPSGRLDVRTGVIPVTDAYPDDETTPDMLAQRMADRGFGFSQATIWKIERGQRPVRASELVALADSLRVMLVTRLTDKPEVARHQVWLDQANRKAHHVYEILKEAAADYLDAQVELVVAA